MTYTIKITNKNTVSGVTNVNTLYLDTISPSLITDLNSTYEAFIADMEVTDTSIYVPLYKRLQVVKVPASSVLVITTDDSSEATYYRLLKLNNSFILIDPDPITSAYVDPVLIEKTITENGIYHASQDNADGYSLVDVDVPNSYSAEDEGKVVSNGVLVAQTSDTTTSNGTVDTTTISSLTVEVANSYTAGDEGKVVSNGALVSQSTHKPITTNGTGIDTTTYSSVDVDVPNTYTSEDNGKVVNNETLVSQTAYPTEITENDTYDTTNYNSITVNVSGGGGGFSGSDVIFYDYDGTVVASYSAADFANLSVMPTNPTHTGLTAQGWNWTLADAKTYVASNGKLNIGQMYTTSDGKTRLYFTVTKDNLSTELYLWLESGTELDVDWGDGSEHTTWTSNDESPSQSHNYTSAGRYVITIEVITGEFYLSIDGSMVLSNIYKINIGNGVTGINYDAFNGCYTLSSITIPDSLTYIDYGAFYDCRSLSSITIPSSITVIYDDTFNGCRSLSSITIPNSVTYISHGAFRGCYALSSITIPDSVTSINTSNFEECYALSSITIPDSVVRIGDTTLKECYALSSITIPNSVASIGTSTFYYCHSLSSITFESSTPPELSGYLEIPNTCIIRVPQGTLSDYTSAEYYPDPNNYIYEEY